MSVHQCRNQKPPQLTSLTLHALVKLKTQVVHGGNPPDSASRIHPSAKLIPTPDMGGRKRGFNKQKKALNPKRQWLLPKPRRPRPCSRPSWQRLSESRRRWPRTRGDGFDRAFKGVKVQQRMGFLTASHRHLRGRWVGWGSRGFIEGC